MHSVISLNVFYSIYKKIQLLWLILKNQTICLVYSKLAELWIVNLILSKKNLIFFFFKTCSPKLTRVKLTCVNCILEFFCPRRQCQNPCLAELELCLIPSTSGVSSCTTSWSSTVLTLRILLPRGYCWKVKTFRMCVHVNL